MPKIGKENFSLRTDELHEGFSYDLVYTRDLDFHCILPDKYNEAFDAMPEEKLSELFAVHAHGRGYNKPAKRIVFGKTEEEFKTRLHAFILALVKVNVVKDKVIILEFENHTSGPRDYQQADLKTVGLELKVTYCTRVTSPGSKYPKYYKYKKSTFHKKEMDVDEVSLSYRMRQDDPDASIIPDTPENRLFLESLHSKLFTLQDQMEKFIGDRKSLLKAIASNQKLIS